GRMVVIGAGTAALHGFPVDTRPWSEETEVSGINSFDVGIMPLRDDPWERGKCGYKLIQYMACGRPVVASPVGVNRAIVDHGVNGFLASSHEEWVRYLARLRDDPATRGVMGMAARRTVEAEFSLRVAAPRLLELLRSAIGGCH
ncbi:glycosyltransferase, partial [bacterium]|nr:glycosyltransferase [bacterium]